MAGIIRFFVIHIFRERELVSNMMGEGDGLSVVNHAVSLMVSTVD